MSNSLSAIAEMADPFVPFFPDFPTILMPQSVLDAQINNAGMRFGWCKAHACPCTRGKNGGNPGSPDPKCLACFGRGTYWDDPINFVGLFTFMHTSAAPDEPGNAMNPLMGTVDHGGPTVTIPFSDGCGNPIVPWAQSNEKDAFIELDVAERRETPLIAGVDTFLPYKQNISILSVTAYDPIARTVGTVSSENYGVTGASVVLNPEVYPDGTGYTVEYTVAPVYVAFRKSGGLVHARPAGQGANLPKRFHLELLDVWTRNLKNAAAQSSPI